MKKLQQIYSGSLNDATNPFIQPEVQFLDDTNALKATSGIEESVTVVEEKQVGEYEVTVLTATDADDLVEWLDDNDYNFTNLDSEKMEYYVAQEEFHFVALKVDASHFNPTSRPIPVEINDGIGDGAVPLDELLGEESEEIADIAALTIAPGEWWWGELSPIQIQFKADQPQLPMRTLESNMSEMTFDLYTLSDTAVYVPGVDTVYSNLIDAEFLKQAPVLHEYEPKGKWLVRQEVVFDPSESREDLFLKMVDTNDFTTVDPGSQVRFDPSSLDTATGIIPGVRGQVVRTDGSGSAFTFSRNLTIGSVGEDVRILQKLLNDEGFIVSDIGAGSPLNETTHFGNRTKQALIQYQNFYRADILEPIGLTTGTGYFGPATINFINR